MTSTFGGLSTALSALNAQRRGLDVTGQNIANANTPGYTRQRVVLSSVDAAAVPAMWSRSTGIGNGVDASKVQRLGDDFLSNRSQTEHGRLTQLTTAQTTLAQIESSFGEPSDTGIQSQLTDFWNAWGTLVSSPTSDAARSGLLQTANTLSDSFNSLSTQLGDQWASQREQLNTVAASINTAAKNVADLNKAIASADAGGLPANELKDKRDSAVDELTKLSGATTKTREDGGIDVYIGGNAIVRGTQVSPIKAPVSGAAAMVDASSDPVRLEWADGTPVAAPGGQAGGLLEALGTTLPSYSAQLDDVAASLAAKVNDLHRTGYDKAGDAGGAFFSGTTAASLGVAVTDSSKIAASAIAPTVDGNGNTVANSDGSLAGKLAALAGATDGPDAAYRTAIVNLGVAADTVNRRVEIQQNVSAQVDTSLDAQVGVSTDEEMVNLLSYQHAYAAAAKVMSAVNEMLDTLINRTGN